MPTNAQAPDLLRVDEAARRLGIAARTLDHWRAHGRGPKWLRLGTRAIRYPADQLEAWLAAQAAGSTRQRDDS